MSKRPSNSIWKIKDVDGKTPQQTLNDIISAYESKVRENPIKNAPMELVALKDEPENARLKLYIRIRYTKGIFDFLREKLSDSIEPKKFASRPKDVCLFITTSRSLYVITSGSGYHIIENFVDYAYPFDIAKKALANNFKAAQKRKLNSSALDVNEKYRRDYHIDKSESFGTIWKNLVGSIDYASLPSGSFLKSLLNPDRASTADIKSSFTIKKSLNLDEVIKLIDDLETLPEPAEEHRRAMEFLDCLQPVKKAPSPKELDEQLIEYLRTSYANDRCLDFDVYDPKEIGRYYEGSGYKLASTELGNDRPDSGDVLTELKALTEPNISDAAAFRKQIKSIKLYYLTGDTEELIAISIIKAISGQLDYNGQTYFKIDGDWYRGQGDYLAVLKKDFISEVFEAADRTLTESIALPQWADGHDEGEFNRIASRSENWFFGDKIFLRQRGRGKIELFDLIFVDHANQRLYIVHSKDDFDAKMRDVCSQLETARDIIESSVGSNYQELATYYMQWIQDPENANRSVNQDVFISWFKYERIYVALCSTSTDFTKETFERDTLGSHIARRETLIARQEFKGRGVKFYLAHTKKVRNG